MRYPGLESMNTESLEMARDDAERRGDWSLMERIEAELERRDYDASDPWSPQNHHD